MRTRSRISSALLLVVICFAACDGSTPSQDIDANWGDLSSAERVAYLEAELEVAKADLRASSGLDEWDEAYQRAKTLLSLLRPEIWPEQRDRYLRTEAQLDELAKETRG